MAYPSNTNNINLVNAEKEVLDFWAEEAVFTESVDTKPIDNEWIFFDGPPFANGLPHYGHLLTSTVKDCYARYHAMKGERVERRFGWDCHGLPAEMEAEKELNIQGQIAIQEYGIEKFNKQCSTSVLKYTQEWRDYINRMARWVDFDNEYKTMDKGYMESVMWAFSELHKKGLIYEGSKVMPYSWACETPLSNFETRMDNAYREREDKAITVAFELKEQINGKKAYILAWTTTPWTLPSNLALAINPDMDYKLEEVDNNIYISALSFASLTGESNKKDLDSPVKPANDTKKGSFFVGLGYKPLFPYFENQENAFKVLSGDFVEEGSGTGIVHLAPGFGEDDQRVCKENGIDVVCPVDQAGKYTDDIFDLDNLTLKGVNVIAGEGKAEADPFDEKQIAKYGLANLRIIHYLKQTGQLVKQENYNHNYPHCWRTDTPLIYKAIPSYYVAVEKFKHRMVELNQNINWIPNHIKEGLFGKWLEGARDWAISRNRFWGAPIPIWKSESGKSIVVGSIEELEKLSGKKVQDLHRPYIDDITIEQDGEVYKRVPDVLDCWFESGSMPFAQLHYPFENKEKFEANFPADFIVEYTAQTRGWFYTLMVLSTALFDSEPFKNVICHGVILGESEKDPNTNKIVKQKLSKRKKNYADPLEVFEKFGADAMRFTLLSSPVCTGGELQVTKDGSEFKDTLRLVINPIQNAYHFFCLYANIDGIEAVAEVGNSNNLLDKYILSKLSEALTKIDKGLNEFNSPSACEAITDFFEVLNNWYIRRNRNRFWEKISDSNKEDKQAAYNTLYTCITEMMKASAPIIPLTSEYIYRALTSSRA